MNQLDTIKEGTKQTAEKTYSFMNSFLLKGETQLEKDYGMYAGAALVVAGSPFYFGTSIALGLEALPNSPVLGTLLGLVVSPIIAGGFIGLGMAGFGKLGDGYAPSDKKDDSRFEGKLLVANKNDVDDIRKWDVSSLQGGPDQETISRDDSRLEESLLVANKKLAENYFDFNKDAADIRKWDASSLQGEPDQEKNSRPFLKNTNNMELASQMITKKASTFDAIDRNGVNPPENIMNLNFKDGSETIQPSKSRTLDR